MDKCREAFEKKYPVTRNFTFSEEHNQYIFEADASPYEKRDHEDRLSRLNVAWAAWDGGWNARKQEEPKYSNPWEILE